MTRDVANELWIARENLSEQGKRTDLTSEQKFKGWGIYCEEIGIAQQTANRWLNRWFPEQLEHGGAARIVCDSSLTIG